MKPGWPIYVLMLCSVLGLIFAYRQYSAVKKAADAVAKKGVSLF